MGKSYVVIGMDFSEPSVMAARWAARHLSPKANLVLAHAVHVPEPPSFLRGLFPPADQLVEDARRGAEVRLKEVAESLGARKVLTDVRVGRPDEALVQVAEEHGAELLVLGPRRQRLGLRILLGSTAERVTRRCRTSVLIARDLPDRGVRMVLAALDESTLAGLVLEWASRLVDGRASQAVVMHVADPMLYGAVRLGSFGAERTRAEEQLRARVQQWLDEQLAGSTLDGAKTHVGLGDPGFQILDAVRQFSADILVIGRHGRRPASGMFLGSVVEFVLREGTGPVLVVGDGS